MRPKKTTKKQLRKRNPLLSPVNVGEKAPLSARVLVVSTHFKLHTIYSVMIKRGGYSPRLSPPPPSQLRGSAYNPLHCSFQGKKQAHAKGACPLHDLEDFVANLDCCVQNAMIAIEYNVCNVVGCTFSHQHNEMYLSCQQTK